MNTYEKMLVELSEELIIDDSARLPNDLKGYYCNEYGEKVILLDKYIETIAEKRCMLAEELGHHYTTVGDILDQSKIENRKQENKARRMAVKKLIRVEQLIEAFNAGVKNRFELAEFLDITEEFLNMALEHFKGIYGLSHTIGDYIIYFEPLYIYKQL